jgi:hypothetical protein
MEAIPENSWNDSSWFNEWLLLARKRRESLGLESPDEPNDKAKAFAEAKLPSSSNPFVEWIYAVQEHATLCLPALGPDFTVGIGKKMKAAPQ